MKVISLFYDIIKEETKWPPLLLYHPTKSEITITATEGEMEQVQIYNALGKNLTHLVHQTRVNNVTFRIELNQLRSGCYFVKTRNTTTTLMKH